MALSTKHKITEVAEGVWMIDEFGMDMMYVVKGAKKSLLIDTGSGLGDLKAVAWELAGPCDVVLTHGHPDHAGGMGQFERVYIHPADMEMAKSITWEGRSAYAQQMMQTYPALRDMIDISEEPQEIVPELVPVSEGFGFDLGDRVIEVIETPGHTPGSICLFDPKTGIVFSGDAFNPLFLLMLYPGEDRRSIQTFLQSADKMMKRRGEYRFMCGGHTCPLDDSVLTDLIACAGGMLDGSIQLEHKKIHIFDGEFAEYGGVSITLDPKIV